MTRVAWMASLSMLVLASLAPLDAIVVRHDRGDNVFLALALRYPSTATVRRANSRGNPGDTGTLIAPRWVLTAAHVAATLRPGDIVELAGATHRIDRVVRHPEWLSNADMRVDIALLGLDEPVSTVAPARIYTESDEHHMVVTFVGRGGNGTGLTGPAAEDRRLRGATNRVEGAEGSLLWFRFDAPGDPGVTDLEGISGPGDSGGPAYVDRQGVRYVVGVSSGQDSRPADRKAGHYKVLEYYPRVSYFAAWIRSVIDA